MNLSREVLQVRKHSNNELREVSRSHSSMKKTYEGLNNSKRQFEMYVPNISLTVCETETYLRGSTNNIG